MDSSAMMDDDVDGGTRTPELTDAPDVDAPNDKSMDTHAPHVSLAAAAALALEEERTDKAEKTPAPMNDDGADAEVPPEGAAKEPELDRDVDVAAEVQPDGAGNESEQPGQDPALAAQPATLAKTPLGGRKPKFTAKKSTGTMPASRAVPSDGMPAAADVLPEAQEPDASGEVTTPKTSLPRKAGKKKASTAGASSSRSEPAAATASTPSGPSSSTKSKKRAKTDDGRAASKGKKRAGAADKDGETNGKKAKLPKDPHAPRRALSGYQHWSVEARKTDPIAGLAFCDQSKALGAAWKAMSAAEKAPWEQKAKADKKRYEDEMKGYTPPPAFAKPVTPKTSKKAAAPTSTARKGRASTTPSRRDRKARKQLEDAEEDVDKDEDEDADEDERDEGLGADVDTSEAEAAAGGGTPGFCRPLIKNPRSIPKPDALPLIEELDLEDRELIPMRADAFAIGQQIAWVPQCFAQFLAAHEAALSSDVLRDASSSWPSRDSRQMRKPADGTANAAIVERVQKISEIDGLSLLHLRATNALAKGAPAATSRATMGTSDGSDDTEGDSDADESGTGSSFTLPVLSRAFCDVDAHVISLKDYVAGMRRTQASPHVAVPFAASDDAHLQSKPLEVLWEGRAFERDIVYDPEHYPKSAYKSLHVVWYRALKQGPGNRHMERWILDDEQTDNRVSPWETMTSKMHQKWAGAYPALASLVRPRTKRGVIAESAKALIEAGESMDIDDAVAQNGDVHELTERVLKRLLSNEASSFFWHPVPPTELEYHATITSPLCLSEIADRAQRHEYTSYANFHVEVERLLSDAFCFHEPNTLGWVLTEMMQAELHIVRDELLQHGCGHLLEPADVPYDAPAPHGEQPEATTAASA